MSQEDIEALSSLLTLTMDVRVLDKQAYAGVVAFFHEHIEDQYTKTLLSCMGLFARNDNTHGIASMADLMHEELVENHKMKPLY